ncbi:MAG: choice-of-anchor D domain-containing protein [Flavobacterium sp.]|uniref:choice-of-anchor D domain-containing protein n=1 Tax=Flavobacterium sp. TaxID=239 RepID=UPI0022BC8BA9|nr:choice-of-anchor D domain-containing protein [Flavobacterium sp.]MCZ8331081.1 choice-of-anchor D domain-containing protein [Flavobacterium sp.]
MNKTTYCFDGKAIGKLLFTVLFIFTCQLLSAQVVIARQDFETIPAVPTMTFTTSNIGSPGASTGFSTGTSGASNAAPTNANLFTEGSRGYRVTGPSSGSTTAGRTLIFSDVNTTGYTGISLSFRVAAMSIGSASNGMESIIDEVLIEVSPDGGTTWYQQAKVNVTGAGSNARWSFSATGSGTRAYAADNAFSSFSSNNTITTGQTLTGANAVTTATITGLPAVTNLKVRLSAQSNSVNESWILDDVRISGTVAALAPEINVQGNSTNIVSDDTTPSTTDHTDFGSVNAASGSVVRTFTIQNTGSAALNISDAYLLDGTSGFSITSAPASSVAASGSTTIQVTFDPSSAGTFNDEVVIESDDADEGTYTFAITGVGFVATPEINVQGNAVSIVDGDITPSTADHTDFGSVTTSSGSVVRTFTIQNTGSAALNISSAYLLDGASGFSITSAPASSVAAAGSTTIQVTFDPASAGTFNDELVIESDDADEATYTFAITGFGIAPQPEINVTGNAVSIVSGDVTPALADHTDFGSVGSTNTIVRTYTIQNTGDAPLVLGSPAVLLDQVDGFSVTQQPTSPVGVGSSTTFEITFTPSVAGVDTNTVLIDSNDANEGTYSFAITGIATVVAPVATAATSVGASSFTANWNAVDGATSYEIDVYEVQTGSNATDLFISEYVEGEANANNKYIEIFNGTGVDVNLSDYRLRLYANGSASATTDILLSGVLANGDTMVYRANTNGDYTGASNVNGSVNYNGDDAVVLYKISTTSNVDIFGRIGNDPGTAWTGSGGYTTLNKTLRRKSTVTEGVTVNPTGTGATAFTTLTTEWDMFNADVVSGLGSHTFDGGTSVVYFLQNENVANTTSYNVTGLDEGTTYYYVVRAISGSVETANSNEISATTGYAPVTWTGGAWSNVSGPTNLIDAVIADTYVTADDGEFTAKSLTVTTGGSLTVSSGDVVTVVGALDNELTSSAVVVENNGVLMQGGTSNLNTGSITVRRNSSAILRQDYTLWSSPVAGQGLYAFSPTTLPNRFYTYNTSTNLYSNSVGFNLTGLQFPSPLVAPNGINGTDTNNVLFATAKGYLIRTPWNHPTAPTVFAGQFAGVPNSGDITYTMSLAGTGFNLVGNPYPSPISMETFVDDNAANITTSLYFWRETNGNTSNNAYCQWNDGLFQSNGQSQVFDPQNVIRTGQGFIVDATGAGTALVFNNGQRVANTANQFFRQNNTQDVYWLNLTNAEGAFSQTVVSYKDYASNGLDRYDGKNVGTSQVSLSSLIDGQEYGIQGKAAFVDTDVVPMHLKVEATGSYTISIEQTQGLFNQGQAIYLNDKLSSKLHNFASGSYSFTSEAGTFDERFEVVYRDAALSVDVPTLTEKQVVIYKNQANDFVINTGDFEMSAVKVFDVRGRLLVEKQGINATQTSITAGLSNEVLLVQIKTVDGAVVTKKVIR